MSLLTDRLTILVGAGLSMAAPSNLPSTKVLADAAKAKYESLFGTAPFGADISEQADYFYKRDQLATIYLNSLIDRDAFAAPHNAAHLAVADLMLVQGLKTAVTTNVDIMIESAGLALYGQIETGSDANAMALIGDGITPLLKLHGCRHSGWLKTIWSALQLTDPDVQARIAGNSAWLSQRLANRDILVVGYCTDWNYLNETLKGVLGNVLPASVTFVDPSSSTDLRAKAPDLVALGERANVAFLHVQQYGDIFLDALRIAFSKSFLRQILHSGGADYLKATGSSPRASSLEPPDLSSEEYWRTRRDLEGCGPSEPAHQIKPLAGPLLGMTLLQIREAGGMPIGSLWQVGSKTARVLRAESKSLDRVAAQYERDAAPINSPDVVIAVGADDLGLPSSVARPTAAASIARGAKPRWLTRQQAIDELRL